MKKTSKIAREFAEDMSERMRVQMEKFRPAPEKVYQIHHNIRRMTNQFDVPGPDMHKVLNFNVKGKTSGDIAIDDIPVRLYIPHQAGEAPGPCLIYLHGGGFVTCSVDSHDGIARRRAFRSGFRVLSVDYRLAPQHPYPAGPED